jgi:hypothetical protein
VAALETARATELLSDNYRELSQHARRALCRMRRRPTLVCPFWEQAERFPLYLYYVIINSSLCSRFCQVEKLAAEL